MIYIMSSHEELRGKINLLKRYAELYIDINKNNIDDGGVVLKKIKKHIGGSIKKIEIMQGGGKIDELKSKLEVLKGMQESVNLGEIIWGLQEANRLIGLLGNPECVPDLECSKKMLEILRKIEEQL
jgi:hypothetical protein